MSRPADRIGLGARYLGCGCYWQDKLQTGAPLLTVCQRPPIKSCPARLRTDTALRVRACTRAREIIEEFSLGSIASPVRPTVSRARRYHTDHADVGAGLVGAAIGQR